VLKSTFFMHPPSISLLRRNLYPTPFNLVVFRRKQTASFPNSYRAGAQTKHCRPFDDSPGFYVQARRSFSSQISDPPFACSKPSLFGFQTLSFQNSLFLGSKPSLFKTLSLLVPNPLCLAPNPLFCRSKPYLFRFQTLSFSDFRRSWTASSATRRRRGGTPSR
jgi:hypothetical protein